MKKIPAKPLTKNSSLEALETRFKRITRKESHVKLDQASQEFVREWLLIRYDTQDATQAEKDKLFAWGESLMKDWDTDEPALAHSQKIINRLSGVATGAASKYADTLETHRQNERHTLQVQRGNTKKRDTLTNQIQSILDSHPDVTPEILESRLRALVGGGVIQSMSDEYIDYYPKPGLDSKVKTLRITSLPSKLSRLKKLKK